ncbi:hypothetical protein R2A130_1722 [Ahrensia sp. R2A130]|nr:hypothetical protein R2A130_1722 [Ahrensia sp. R2A130]
MPAGHSRIGPSVLIRWDLLFQAVDVVATVSARHLVTVWIGE